MRIMLVPCSANGVVKTLRGSGCGRGDQRGIALGLTLPSAWVHTIADLNAGHRYLARS
jgi:hypothetical protein